MKKQNLGVIKIHDIKIDDLTKEKVRELFNGRIEEYSENVEYIYDSTFLNKECRIYTKYSDNELVEIKFSFKNMFIRGFEAAIYTKYKDMFIHDRNYDRHNIEVGDLYIFENGYISATIEWMGGLVLTYVVKPYEETRQMIDDANQCIVDAFVGI